jgi:hypothetical protein
MGFAFHDGGSRGEPTADAVPLTVAEAHRGPADYAHAGILGLAAGAIGKNLAGPPAGVPPPLGPQAILPVLHRPVHQGSPELGLARVQAVPKPEVAAQAVGGIPRAVPKDMPDGLFRQLARATALMRLPVLGDVPDHHVSAKHRLHRLTQALRRQGSNQPTSHADINLLNSSEAAAMLPHPLQVVPLQGCFHHGDGLLLLPPGSILRPGTCFVVSSKADLLQEAAEANQRAIA